MDPRTTQVIQLMALRLPTALSVAALAAAVNLSASRLSHVFRAEMGCSLMEYLRRLRLARARELAEGTLLSVKEIASAVGLQDVSHFVRDFKKAHGMTPARYRRQHLARVLLDPSAAARLANDQQDAPNNSS